MRRACETYGLIKPGDRIGVGVSGGKDSLAMLVALAGYRRYAKVDFELMAFSVDPQFFGSPGDYSAITALCEELGVRHIIKRSNLYDVVFEQRKESNPCALCAKMRRGMLHDMCKENGCNKLALGHHLDDAVDTFYMNLFNEGRIASFSPLTYLSRKDLWAIRPLVLCTESEVAAAVAKAQLPVLKSACPKDKHSEREEIKKYVAMMEQRYPGFLNRTFTALQNAHISGL